MAYTKYFPADPDSISDFRIFRMNESMNKVLFQNVRPNSEGNQPAGDSKLKLKKLVP